MNQKELRRIEETILKITDDPKYCRLWSMPREIQNRISDLLCERIRVINQWYLEHITEKDIKRFEEVNGQLLDLTQNLYKKATQTYRTLLQHTDIFPPEDTTLEVGLKCKCDEESDLLSDPNYHYGTDFSAKIISIIQQTEEAVGLEYFEDFRVDVDINHRVEMDNEQLGFVNVLDDGTTWAEGWLTRPCFKNICICHAVHALCTHQHFAIPDMLRMKRYSMIIKIESGQNQIILEK